MDEYDYTPKENSEGKKYFRIRKLLSEIDSESIVEKILTRKDGLNHLLLSDIETLFNSISTDFPEVASVISIGKTTEGKDINLIKLSLKEKAGDLKKSQQLL